MELFNTLVRFFQSGGLFMYPILVVMAIGFAIAIERFIYLRTSRSANIKTWDALFPLLQSGKYREALTAAGQSKAAVAKILSYGLSRTTAARRREDIETAMEEGLMEIIPRLEKRTHYLATFANISTLLGLLGTVSGLITAFAAVATADPAAKAEMLSAAISEAMNCTAFGLGAAIPLMLAYSFLQSKTTEVVDSMEMVAVKFLNMIQEHAHRVQQAQQARKEGAGA